VTAMKNNYLEKVEKYLPTLLPSADCEEKNLILSMEYSLLAKGKRLRPTLLLAFCDLCGGDTQAAMPYACAIEMIHAYSLIHDDLPCMDDDDLRRGRPSNHIVFGEDIALLAGDALQSLAFEVMLNNAALEKTGVNGAKAAGVLSKACGAVGMVGGQVIDLETEGKSASLDTLTLMYSKKTGALIKAACVMGCILANADDALIKAAERYAENIGLAFQIVDDILDVTSTTEVLGKPVGSDKENEKVNYVTVLGLEKSRDIVNELTMKAVNELTVFDDNADFLKSMALDLAKRVY